MPKFEAGIAMTLRAGEADDLDKLERSTFMWTGWTRRLWPAGVLRPGVRLYAFDKRDRQLRALSEVTRGGSFVYRTRRDFAEAVERATGWYPAEDDPHLGEIPVSRNRFNTGISIRWRVIKAVRIPLDVRFPRIGWLKLDPATLPQETVDPAEEFEEGGRAIRQHMRIERNRTLRERAKQLWIAEHGRLFCEICGYDFKRTFGNLGADFIEMHHNVPLHSRRGRHRVRPEELRPLCANCHRMAHRERPYLRVSELRAHIRRVKHRVG